VTAALAKESMRSRFSRTVADLLDTDERVAIVLADIGTGLLRPLGVFDRHPLRVINVGIREQLLVSVAGGLALEGFRPIVHSYAPFLVERPFEQVKLDLGHQGVGAILVSVGASYDASGEGRTHQAPGDVALISTLPGWAIHVPGHPEEVEAILRMEATNERPAYIRLSEFQNVEPVASADGRIVVVRRGSEGAPLVLAVGPMLRPALKACADLDVTVAYAATVRPLDAEALRTVAGNDVVLVEPYLEGTLLGDLAKALSDRPRRYLAIGVPNEEHRRYGTPLDHARALGLDATGIRRRLDAFLE